MTAKASIPTKPLQAALPAGLLPRHRVAGSESWRCVLAAARNQTGPGLEDGRERSPGLVAGEVGVEDAGDGEREQVEETWQNRERILRC